MTTILVLLMSSVLVNIAHSACYKKVNVRWRDDGRCGSTFPVSDRRSAECNPVGDRPCCSDFGFCGNSPLHCRCEGCYDYRDRPKDLCQFVCDGEEGLLDSAQYFTQSNGEQNCYFDLRRTSNEFCGVSLQVEELRLGKLGRGGSCEKAWLSMPSCLPEEETRICGNESTRNYQYLFQRGSRAVRFKVHSEYKNDRNSHFKIKYQLLRTCPGPFQSQRPPISVIPNSKETACYTRISDLKGTINTPYHPAQYPANLDCVYEFIRAGSNVCGIRLKTVRFALEDPISTPFGGACTDFLHVPSCSFLCGQLDFTWQVEYQPGSDSLLLHLHTDGSSNSTAQLGFLMKFQQLTSCD